MSGLLNRLRNRGRDGGGREQAQQDDQQLAGLANTQAYTRNQSSPQETEARQDKGIDFDMIYAEQAVNELALLAHETQLVERSVPVVDEKGLPIYDLVPSHDLNGQTIYQDVPFDANGAVLLMKKPVMVSVQRMEWKNVAVNINRQWATAALVYLDTVMPTIWMGTWEADTSRLYIRTAFHDIRKQMRHDGTLSYEQKQNCVLLLRAVRDLALFRCEDTKEGRKALLLKVRREELGVHMTKGAPNVKGGK
jgi:hypothetical protein